MTDERDTCPHCRRGKVYHPGELLPSDCTSCNGTGIAGNPGCAIAIMAFFVIAGAWIVYRIVEGIWLRG